MVFVEAPKKATATRWGTRKKRRESGRRKSPRPPRGFDGTSFGPHALRATAATNALDRGADLGKVQEWLGHASVSTTRLYDRHRSQPEDSPTFRVAY